MAFRLGIVPAAGKAVRFGGVLKECLPLKRGSLLELAVDRLPVDRVILVTNTSKVQTHAQVLGNKVLYMVQGDEPELWGAIKSALSIDADYYYFTMPDTFMPFHAFNLVPEVDFSIGLFETDMPERFGVLVDGRVVDKNRDIPVPAQAWGGLVWSRAVKNLWLRSNVTDYTHAINLAIQAFGFETWRISFYHDFASIEDYQNYLRRYE